MPKKGPAPAGGSNVEWKTLKTAKGPATRVPALVKALVDGKTPQDRQVAYFTLNQGLHADGAVSPSAAPTVPLLAEVLASHKAGAHRAAWLMGEALTAGHERVLVNPDAPVGGSVDEVRKAVEDCKAVLLAALADSDALVRTGAAFALTWAPGLADVSRPALRKQLSAESSDLARMSLLLALGVLGRGHSAPDDHAALKVATGSPAVRGVAVLVRLLLGGKVSPIEGAEDVVALLQSPVDREGTPWCGGHVDRLVVSIATRLKARAEVALAVAAKLDVASPGESWRVPARALLELGGFTEQWKERDVALPEELSPTQTTIARILALRDAVDGIGWGVPRSGRDRRRWLGLTAPGPLEKRLEAQRNWPVWRVWLDRVAQSASADFPPAVVAALSADEVLEAYAEVCLGAYGIGFNRRQPSADAIAAVADKTSPMAAEWARRFAAEVVGLIQAGSVPELGGVLGMPGSAAVYLAILKTGGAIPPDLYAYFPWGEGPLAHDILEMMAPEQREPAIWARMSPHPGDLLLVKLVLPLLDLVPSKRIAEALVARLRNPIVRNMLGPDAAENSMAQIKAVAEKHPAVAEALG
ncbi:MAG TPA: hypothetical protein VGL81_16625 [Polyangiaceae bacterium]